jgi:hypothetical protein
MPKPVFRHDCSSCTYLGLYYLDPDDDTSARIDYDLYFCPVQAIGGSTVIARFGDDGRDYLSGLAIADNVPALREAKRRARERGLLA